MRNRLFIFVIMVALYNVNAPAQSTTESSVKYFNIQKTVLPPYLQIVDKSVVFKDADGNNVINANEASTISFRVQNTGRGAAYGCVAKIVAKGSLEGLTFANQKLNTIPVGETQTITIPISASELTATGSVQFTITIDEPNGFGTDPVQLTVKTHKFDSPMVEIVSYKIVGDGDTQLRKKTSFKLQVLVQNTDQGEAKNISVSLIHPDNMFNLNENQTVLIPILKPNESKLLEYELQTNASIPDDIKLNFELSESYGRFAKNGEIPLHFGQAISSAMIAMNIVGQDKENVEITKGSLISDVDENIPVTNAKNTNTFAVIIANEKYMSVAAVPFALNDGMKFREYCVKTLGIPEKNIHYIANATGNQIKAQVQWLQNVTKAYEQEEPNIIFYYAGHGIPDESSKTAYLLPVDGIGTDVTTGYKLDNLYSALGQMPSVHTTIFLDACFSGSKREDGMLASARGIAIKAKSGVPQGNMVVFSAAQGDETAYPNKEEGHGMFTYYLLKKLQDTKGDVTLQDLGNYITKNVSQQSILINGKSQTPSVTAAVSLGNSWREWKLK